MRYLKKKLTVLFLAFVAVQVLFASSKVLNSSIFIIWCFFFSTAEPRSGILNTQRMRNRNWYKRWERRKTVKFQNLSLQIWLSTLYSIIAVSLFLIAALILGVVGFFGRSFNNVIFISVLRFLYFRIELLLVRNETSHELVVIVCI